MARYCADIYVSVCLCCMMWKTGAIPLVVKPASGQKPAVPIALPVLVATGSQNFAVNDPWSEEVSDTPANSLSTPSSVQTTRRPSISKPPHQVSVIGTTTKAPAGTSSSLVTTRRATTSAVTTTILPVPSTQTSVTTTVPTTPPAASSTVADVSETTTNIPPVVAILTANDSQSTEIVQGNVEIPESAVSGRLTVTAKEKPSVAHLILRPLRITRRKMGVLPRLTDKSRKIDVVVELI